MENFTEEESGGGVSAAGSGRRFSRWKGRLILYSVLGIVVAGGYYGYRRVSRYGLNLLPVSRYVRPPNLPMDLVEVRSARFVATDHLAPGSAEAVSRQRASVRAEGLAVEARTRQTGIALRLVPAGTCVMGSPVAEKRRDRDEGPVREVIVRQPLYVGKFEVTQAEWHRVMNNNPARFRFVGGRAPVEQVSWDDVRQFLARLCEKEGVATNTYRLPTEEEWEYFCRAGTDAPFCYGRVFESDMANFEGTDPYDGLKGVNRRATVPAGSFPPNAWGLHDTHGNVAEWCADWYVVYPSGSVTDVKELATGPCRVMRGGSWAVGSGLCRSAYRDREGPHIRRDDVGFRIVRGLNPEPRESEREEAGTTNAVTVTGPMTNMHPQVLLPDQW